MIIALQTLVFFRESLLTALNRLLSPYYKRIRGTFKLYNSEEEEDDEEVFAEFDDEKGVVFYPPMYAQRYAAVSDCLMDERWCGKLAKVVDLGYHDMSFIKYLKDLPGVECILGVDIESIPLRCSSDLLDTCGQGDYGPKRDNPLQITLFQGNAADPDYRLIGCDAVVAIEMIEHMLPHDLDRLVHTIFGFIKPWVVIITTPNADFNELFKALEKNGLRRWDHFFEWTREQFHDWCSNIVSRYPQFTVTCQGVGPGPPGTEHHGCCSQLALFVNKSYVKQQDLNLNSLAMVSNVPSPQNLAELFTGFESPVTDAGLRPNQNVESLTNFLYSNKQSCVTLILSTPAFSLTNIEYKDKTSQCNLDTEVGKNFLMFNDEDMYYTMLMPRRKFESKVYEIGDVASRLNCTTFQARKFSKTTQNLMAKNRIDNLAHTREVVGEIRNLTRMLNFNKDPLTQKDDSFTWCNINWGENAPYWNQYFKVVRDYNYPFEQKSEECRILDLISEEINQLIDMHYEDECTSHENKLEIPIEFLMKAVRHITNDVEKVKDLLEWNGYTVVGNFVVHTRVIVDSASVGSSEVDWPDHDTTSELDTIEVQSTPVSDRSALVPDTHHGRCLRRELDKKVRALRSMLSADEDITEELDKVVCKLMKLALRTGIERQGPPPARWMQFKLLDLLTLTEKAISRRKNYYIENYPSKVSDFDRNIKTLNKLVRDERAAKMIVDKYNHLIPDSENWEVFDDLHFGFEDELGEQYGSNEFLKDYSPKSYVISVNNGQVSLVNENLELVPYADHTTSDQASSKGARKKYVRSPSGSFVIEKSKSRKRSHSKIANGKHKPDDSTSKSKKSKTSLAKKPVRAKISSHSSLKINGKKGSNNDYKTYSTKARKIKIPKKLQPSPSKPYSASERDKDVNPLKDHKKKEGADVSATEESVLINIVMDDKEETIALRRSIGTDPDFSSEEVEQEAILSSIINEEKNFGSFNKLQNSSENVHSQTIFLFDINEPSTSKGVRHVSMDVQCGTDAVLPPNGLVTPATSVTKITKMYSTGIRIDSSINVATENNITDFGTCTNIDNNQGCRSACKSSSIFSKGIKIGNSQENITKRVSECSTMTTIMFDDHKVFPETRSSRIKTKDSWSDMGGSKPYDFGIFTHKGNEKYKKITTSSGTNEDYKCTRAYSGTNSESEFKFNNEEINSITPKTKSRDMLTNLPTHGSLNNLLLNFNAKTDYKRNAFSVNDAGCQSPDLPCSPFRNISYPSRSNGIIIRDSSTDNQTRNNVDHSTSTNNNPKTSWDALHTESSIVYTSVKMIDFVNEVTIEQDSQMNTSPQFSTSTPCKILDSKYFPKKPHEFKFTLKNPLHLKSQTRDIDTCTNVNGEENFTDDFEAQISSDNTVTHINDGRMPTAANEHDNQHNFMYAEIIKNGSFTKFNMPRQTMIVQNDTLDASNTNSLTKSFGFKVKDSDDNVIKKIEFSSTRVELLSDSPNSWTTSKLETNKIEMLKSVSSKIKMEDSVSEFYGSNYCTSHKNQWQGTIPPVNTSEAKIIKQSLRYNGDINCKEKASLPKILQNKLSCGGIHIHSFKEKQVSEDIVYLGEWKRYAPKFPRKQNNGNTIVVRKIMDPVKKTKIRKDFSKHKLQIKKIDTNRETINEPKKPQKVRNTKLIKAKQEIINKSDQIKKVTIPNIAKVIRANNKSLTKVAPKIMPSTITSKNIKSMRSAKKPPNCVKLTQLVKNDCGVKSEPIRRKHIDYLPPYLRRKLFASSEIKLNNKIDSNKTSNLEGKYYNEKGSFKRSKNEVNKTSFTKLQDEPQSNIKYLVFRNDIEKTNPPANTSQSADIANKTETTNRRRGMNKRSSSPLSQASSTCSTSDSITTVRPTNNWNRASRKHSTSSNKSSLVNTDSETSPSANKNRKFSKKCKINKKSDGKDHSNKENVPESSKTCYPEKQMCLHNIKSAFMSRSKNMFMAKIEDNSVLLNDKHQISTKSNIKIPLIESDDEQIKPKNVSKKSLQSDDSSSKEEIIGNQESIKSEPSNLVLLIEPHRERINIQEKNSQQVTPEEPVLKVVDSSLLTEWFERGKNSAIDKENTENAILAQMRQLVEERLDFISNPLNDSSFDDNMSIKSYRTIVPAHDTDLDNTLKSEIENAMNHSLDAVLGDASDLSFQNESATDADLISFKSVTSTPRYSEYYMADSDTSKTGNHSQNKVASSVLDLFERKDLTSRVQHTPGTIAAQAFSGFSMDGSRIMGGQSDYMNVDSEIGVDVTRQATSEEMFISGRSSETYESCVVEEEVSVPDWLFHVMNPQLMIDEEEDQQELIPLRMPLVEPVFDANGNLLEPGIGLGAGAGDGRGMHSDHSQDSSGRGSSLSSSDASSGPHSEAILIDPSAFTTQLEMFHEPVGSSMALTTLVVPVGSPETNLQRRNVTSMVSTSRNMALRPAPLLMTSDGEADVSSIDTDDIPDSS